MAYPALAIVGEEEETVPPFTFDDAFQSKIAALAIRDAVFLQRCDGLLRPEYFQDAAEATLVNIVSGYYQKYKRCPDIVTLAKLLKDALTAKAIREDMRGPIGTKINELRKLDISDRDFVVDQVAEFARHQAVEQAILKAVELLEKRKFDDIEGLMKKAMNVGANSGLSTSYDYAAEIESRTIKRKELLTGVRTHDGITTGHRDMDKELAHYGWGRKELSLMMGAAKAGKSMSLGEFAKNATLAGKNALYVTLEVSKDIIADRLDAAVSHVAMKVLGGTPHDVEARVKAAMAKAGKLFLEEFPTGSMRPSDLRRKLDQYLAKGMVFDLVVVDYADIMAPEHRTDNDIANFRSIYVDLRAIAQEYNVALLTATQTNREGAKKATASMTDVAEDFNKIRIADVVISINATDDEKAAGEARLFFAASRNQEDGFTIRIKQDRSCMRFIASVLGRD